MAEYMVGVELFNVNAEEYNQFHEQLSTQGLFRQIKSDNGLYCDMPSGTYFGESKLSVSQLQEWVSSVADQVSSPGAAVFVVRIAERCSFLQRSK
ncbi:hypothetical protein [Pseudomonas sp. CAM1A]|uniref:hypothetical protein n=1 Tax=Pseudomonas sp. CAM1A TaxID=3231717 RepID=UPI0039C5E3C6